MVQLLGVLLCLTGPGDLPGVGQQACVVCHGEQGQHMKRSVHAKVGLSCADCHGGLSQTLAEDDMHGDDLRPLTDPLEAVQSCGGCHSDLERMRLYGQRTDQLALYQTSQHGRRLAQGDGASVATCVSCHGAHEVLQASDPRSPVHRLNQVETCGRCHADPDLMQAHGLGSDGSELYRRSVHGRALLEQGRVSSPACADCHGSHGATPPRVEEVGEVCGSCHTVVRGYFEGGAHMPAAEAGRMSECVSCHGSHGVSAPGPELLLGDGPGHCGSCHTDPGDPALAVAGMLSEGLANLDRMIEDTEQELEVAAKRGLFIARENGYLDDARGLRARASALTHALSPEALQDLQNRCQGMIGQTLESLGVKYRSLRDRRIFAGLFLLVVALLALVLMIFRREISGGWDAPAGDRDEGADHHG